jgi:hypothetical protein
MNKKTLALGRLPAGVMNATEAAYAQKLELEKRAGAIHDYQFEPCSLRLGKNLHYTPDFLVIGFDMVVEFREVKGQWQDDARAKIKMAATKFPWFRFIAIRKKSKKDGGGWDIEVF